MVEQMVRLLAVGRDNWMVVLMEHRKVVRLVVRLAVQKVDRLADWRVVRREHC